MNFSTSFHLPTLMTPTGGAPRGGVSPPRRAVSQFFNGSDCVSGIVFEVLEEQNVIYVRVHKQDCIIIIAHTVIKLSRTLFLYSISKIICEAFSFILFLNQQWWIHGECLPIKFRARVLPPK